MTTKTKLFILTTVDVVAIVVYILNAPYKMERIKQYIDNNQTYHK